MQSTLLILATLAACSGPAKTAGPPSNTGTADPPSELAAVDWMNREYVLFGQPRRFEDGRHADAEQILQLADPIYLDVTGDGAVDALVPLRIEEAPTAVERGNPRFDTLLVISVVRGAVEHLGELPVMTCGPLTAALDGDLLRVTATRRGRPEDMCGGPADTQRYRWDGTWFVTDDGDAVEQRLP